MTMVIHLLIYLLEIGKMHLWQKKVIFSIGLEQDTNAGRRQVGEEKQFVPT